MVCFGVVGIIATAGADKAEELMGKKLSKRKKVEVLQVLAAGRVLSHVR